MLRTTLARLAPVLALVLLAGCAGNDVDGTGTSEGASTAAPPAADAPATPTMAGHYDGRMNGKWDGSLAITSVSPEQLVFEFEISPDENVAPIGRLGGTAKRVNAGYHHDDGSCTIDFEPVTRGSGARRGDLFVNASISCAIMLGIDGHSTSSTALDFTATWRRL